MLCNYGMYPLSILQVTPILLLMHCLIALPFLFWILLLLLSYPNLMALFVSGTPHCFNRG